MSNFLRVFIFITLLLFQHLATAQMNEAGLAPGLSAVRLWEHTGVNLRFHYFPSHKACFGLESNIFPAQDIVEFTLNGHLIFPISEYLGVYPLTGIAWKKEHDQNGWEALFGGGFHAQKGRFAPYHEYIYSVGFRNEGILLLGTFFTIELNKHHG